MSEPNVEQYKPYIEGWRRRLRLEREAAQRRQQQALADAQRVAQFLAERYHVRRVILFGSLVKERFERDSDIDLAVEGLDPAEYFHAWAEVRELTHIPVDLKPLESCYDYFRQRINEEGVVLYEAT